MSRGSANLAVRPDLCDQCGKCVAACPRGDLRIGGGYIYVDASSCDGCLACADVCRRGAISARSHAHGEGLAVKPGDVSRVVVRSRAEAKALRKVAAAGAGKPVARKGTSGKAESVSDAGKPAPAARQAAGPRPRTARLTTDGARWSAIDAAIVAGVLMVGLLAKELVLSSAMIDVMPVSGRALARAGVLAVFYAVQLALLAYLSYRHGMTLFEAFRLKVGEDDVAAIARSVGLVALLLVGTRLLSTVWGALAQAAGWAPTATEALTGVFGSGWFGIVLTVAMVVVVGPLVEELVFRGVIAGSLDSHFGLRVAVLASAAAFAAYHLTPWVLVPTFVLGVALAWLALTRETLWPAYALHALYNGVVVAALFMLPVR